MTEVIHTAPIADAAQARVAAQFTGLLWGLVRTAGGPRPPSDQHWYFPDVFDPGWLARLRLPAAATRPAGQQVALTRELTYDRFVSDAALERAYRTRPRTRVYENVHRTGGCPWLLRTTQYLTLLSGSELEVICSLYESVPTDANLGRHRDMWYGVVVQVEGTKRWEIGHGVLDPAEPTWTVEVTAGDVLLVPEGLPHVVTTPAEPGHSRHLQFALCRVPLEGPMLPTLLG
jgi:hypothetical protein